MNKIFIVNCFEAKILLDMIVSNQLFVVTTSVDSYVLLLNHYRPDRIEFIDLKEEACPLSQISIIADNLAREQDIQTANTLTSLLGWQPATNWEYWDKFYFAASNLSLSRSMQNLTHDFAGCDLMLPFSRGPQDYYYKGRIGSEIIESNLIRCGAKVHRLETDHLPPIIPSRWMGSFIIPNHNSVPDNIELIHLPTCWHDRAELKKIYSSDQIYDIESPYHNVTINEKNKIHIDPNRAINIPDIHLKQLEIQYHGLLGLFDVSEAALQQQASHWIERHKFQLRALIFFAELRITKNASLKALADHDGGLSGPIAYAFRSQQSTVNIHHHSKFVIGPIPDYFPTRLFKYMQPQQELKDIGNRCAARIPNIIRKNRKIDRPARVALLFTDFDFPGGAPMESISNLKRYLKQMIELFHKEGMDIIIRPRPGASLEAMLELDCPVWDGDLETLAENSDAVIGLGQASSAIIDFWVAGCICIQVHTSDLNMLNQYSIPKESFYVISGKNALEDPGFLLSTLKDASSAGK
jgi:hypothetical protein